MRKVVAVSRTGAIRINWTTAEVLVDPATACEATGAWRATWPNIRVIVKINARLGCESNNVASFQAFREAYQLSLIHI